MTDPTSADQRREAAWRDLHDPSTPPLALAQIARAQPDFAPQIARHPNVYPALAAWAAQQSAPVAAAPPVIPPVPRLPAAYAAARQPAPVGPGPIPPGPIPPGIPMQAPESAGRFRALWLTVLAIVVVVPTVAGVITTFVPYGFYSGFGWWAWAALVPPLAVTVAAGVAAPTVGRRVGGIFIGLGATVLALLTSVFALPLFLLGLPHVVMVVLMFLAWAVARPLRGAGYAAVGVLFVAQAIFALGTRWVAYWVYTNDAPLVGIVVLLIDTVAIRLGVVALALAWSRISERHRAAAHRATPEHPAFVAPGATNVMAILALVFAFVFAVLGVVFGHMALGQIRRTGESGRGLAIAGLVVAYVSLAFGVIITIVYVVILTSGAYYYY
ncbi:DUF4190 domain-containing protein [Microbacterium sp. NPDC089189]|uniref:DUF4190 domain-containing protein n=1 Tax=Microbacterium sp. NPDC089189 TaxID=3154972 RepID=UPI003445051F